MSLDQQNSIEFFSTIELPLAASLLCLGFDCNIEVFDNKGKFSFKSTEQLQDTIKKYWNNDLKVSPKDFSQAQRDLKARIREQLS